VCGCAGVRLCVCICVCVSACVHGRACVQKNTDSKMPGGTARAQNRASSKINKPFLVK